MLYLSKYVTVSSNILVYLIADNSTKKNMSYTVTEMLSLSPSKLVLYNKYWSGSSEYNSSYSMLKSYTKGLDTVFSDTPVPNVVKSFHNFNISKNAIKNLRAKINWLHFLASPKTVTTPNKKTIYNFRLSFLTFTLPSKQIHPTSTITADLWNHMLTEIRRSTGMLNYVWRLEFQKNGNVHYHLVTDTFISYQHVLRKWNKIIDKLGYTSAYRDNMKDLTLSDYYKKYYSNSSKSYAEVADIYARGVRSGWLMPNSIDAKSVKNSDNIGAYISKYFSKSKEDYPVKNDLDTIENSSSIRLWYASQSLSKLKNMSFFREELKYDLYNIVKRDNDVKEFFVDYAKMLIFNINNLSFHVKNHLSKLLKNFSLSLNYTPHYQNFSTS